MVSKRETETHKSITSYHLGHDSKSKGKVAEALQPHMVEAMCKADWPAQT
jgi:hypothetical protein